VHKNKGRFSSLRFWLSTGTLLVIFVLLALFLWLRKDNQVLPPVLENPRPVVTLSPDNDRTFLASIDALIRNYAHADSINRSAEWVSRDAHRWLLTRWEGVYQHPEEVEALFAACRKLAGRNQKRYQLLSYVDGKKPIFSSFSGAGMCWAACACTGLVPKRLAPFPGRNLPELLLLLMIWG